MASGTGISFDAEVLVEQIFPASFFNVQNKACQPKMFYCLYTSWWHLHCFTQAACNTWVKGCKSGLESVPHSLICIYSDHNANGPTAPPLVTLSLSSLKWGDMW